MFKVSREDLEKALFNLDSERYIKKQSDIYDVPMVNLGEVCKISQGSSISSKDRIKGDIPYYGSNGIIDYLDKIQLEGEYIITGRVGTLGKYHYINGPFSLCDNDFI